MSEKSRKVRESESPEDSLKSEVESPEYMQKAERPKPKARKKPDGADVKHDEEKNSEIDIPHSEINQLPTANSKLPTETMEVHHHPEVEKKGFKEYVLEGLMIFLAVTMGFFAETIRENISENGKAKELAKSLYQEVYADSVTMERKIKLRTEKDIQLEYFRRYVSDSSLTQLSDKFYPSFAWSFVITSTIVFDPNDGILNQLRNSGALRYFKSTELQNCISNIDVAILNVRNRNGQEFAFVEQFTRPFLLRHYDFKFQDEFTQNGRLSILQAIAQTNFRPSKQLQIRNVADFNRDDAEALASYYLLIIRATKQVYYTPYVEANHNLLQALRKEYNFNNE